MSKGENRKDEKALARGVQKEVNSWDCAFSIKEEEPGLLLGQGFQK